MKPKAQKADLATDAGAAEQLVIRRQFRSIKPELPTNLPAQPLRLRGLLSGGTVGTLVVSRAGALKLLISDMEAQQLAGQPIDVGKYVEASEALERIVR